MPGLQPATAMPAQPESMYIHTLDAGLRRHDEFIRAFLVLGVHGRELSRPNGRSIRLAVLTRSHRH